MARKSAVRRIIARRLFGALDPYTHVERALRGYLETIPEGNTFLNVLDSGVFINVTDFQRQAVGKCLEIVGDLRRFSETDKRRRK